MSPVSGTCTACLYAVAAPRPAALDTACRAGVSYNGRHPGDGFTCALYLAAKTCARCNLPLPTTAFAVDRSRPDGLAFWCRTCKRAWRVAHYDERVAYNAAYRAAHRDECLAYDRAWRAAHREQYNATALASYRRRRKSEATS